jgi:hypothetical protein
MIAFLHVKRVDCRLRLSLRQTRRCCFPGVLFLLDVEERGTWYRLLSRRCWLKFLLGFVKEELLVDIEVWVFIVEVSVQK